MRLLGHPCLVLLALLAATSAAAAPAPRPNIVLIMADDMGFSDIGCYGSEIPTPHLDALAKNGLRFAQFYNTARCSPTRAALLTGLDPHAAGMGTLAEDPGKRAPATAAPGYQEFLNDRCLTIAEALRPSGYRTYMAGKWHLGYHGQEKWPLQRGFDRYYGIISGATSYFQPKDPRGLTLDNTPLPTPTDPNYYTTDAFTDHAVTFVREHSGDAPFFLYLAFNAPHWPLHARPADIALFDGKYRKGWDALRAERHARQLAAGVLDRTAPLSPRDEGARAWDALKADEQAQLAHRMAVYAAQVHRMDWNIGRLVETLRSAGKLDNTLLIFLSDNGACAEPYTDLGGGDSSAINDPAAAGSGGRQAGGKGGSSYGTGWANASNTPFRRYKSRLHEGGISTPLIVHWPAGLKTAAGTVTRTPGYLTDIMPTALDVSGATYPKARDGKPLTTLAGRSLAPLLRGAELPADRWLFWEQYNNKAVRHGDWKAVQPAEPGSPWELYHLAVDRTELNNLAAAQPDRLRDLTAAWQRWAETHQVLPKTRAP
ncbi:arylsulfatase [Horticoccus sp. 23ND18S-11]|uniref:arylsulfatase n=1 Tax=Horticoccus sp. 23ND18S-11 TaxID=3391832 RepID=UPI0039C8C5E0